MRPNWVRRSDPFPPQPTRRIVIGQSSQLSGRSMRSAVGLRDEGMESLVGWDEPAGPKGGTHFLDHDLGAARAAVKPAPVMGVIEARAEKQRFPFRPRARIG